MFRGVLEVPGARLYHEITGTGPVLLLIPGGGGEATEYAVLARRLADRYTVLSYDRRGYGRSTLTGPVPPDRLAADRADAGRLLDALTTAPALVFGGSSGAIVALHLLAGQPDRIARLVSHEPPLASLLPEAGERLAFFARVHQRYRSAGVAAAMRLFSADLGLPVPEIPEPVPAHLRDLVARMAVNQEFWLEHEVRQYPAVVPDLAALAAAGDRLVLAAGRDSAGQFVRQPTDELARRLGRPVLELPGGHLGQLTDPAAFAAGLHAAFAGLAPATSETPPP